MHVNTVANSVNGPDAATLPPLRESGGSTRLLMPFALFVLFAALFLLLRSNQFTAVDGALRCLAVYHDPHLFFHGNNHLLYPVNILLWTKLAAAFGLVARTPADYVHLCQALNAICAAATLLLVWLLIRRITADWQLALALVGAYAFSRAFLLHATNSAEPVVGLAFSVASLFALDQGLRRRKLLVVSLAGLLLALAFASYQAMFLTIALCIWLCLFGPQRHSADSLRMRLRNMLVFCASCGLGIALLFGWAYSSQGIPAGRGMLSEFFAVAGSTAGYGKLSLSKIVNFPVGLSNSFVQVVPDDYQGLRWLVRTHNLISFGAISLTVGFVSLLLVAFARPALVVLRRLAQTEMRIYSLGLLSLAPLFFAPIYWDPLYDKLWLLPLAILTLALACLAGLAGLRFRARNTALALLVTLLLVEVSFNLRAAIVDSRSATAGLKEATEVMSVIQEEDAIVLDFDKISALYIAYSDNKNAIMLPAMLRSEADQALSTQLARCHQTHGKLYFLGILDQTEAQWKPFLGDRLGMPYSSFDRFRLHSRTIRTFRLSRQTITLRVYDE